MIKEFSEKVAIETDPQTKKGRTSHLIETARRHLIPDYFQVDPFRAQRFLYGQDRSRPKSLVDLQIPIGRQESMQYRGEVLGCVGDRPIGQYQNILFPDVFDNTIPAPHGSFTTEIFLREAELLQFPKSEFGGFEAVFMPGNVVLDIGSGEAVADIQLALKFPLATIIGTDILYQNKRRIYPNKAGLQLTYADWHDLQAIPDKSVDAILSVQGIAMWGLPGSARRPDATYQEGMRIIHALNRISKPGTIMRLDIKNEFLCSHIGHNWDISSRSGVFIAEKKD